MTEWKPGDVVTATVKGRENVRLVAGWSKYAPQLRWCELSPRWGDGDDDECWFMPSSVTDIRPLVVIDPEDREQVERLMPPNWHRDFEAIDWLQDHIRSLANPTPPKPPTDITACVTDHRDNIWRLLADGEWVCTSGPDIGEYLAWDRLASERGPLEVQP